MSRAILLLIASVSLVGCKKPPLGRSGAPIHALEEPSRPRALVAYGDSTCAKQRGDWWCWGVVSIDEQHPTPTRMPFEGVVEVALGGLHYCVVRSDRTVACAGNNSVAELGDGTVSTEQRAALGTVKGIRDVVRLAAASDASCAIVEDGARRPVYCWGRTFDWEHLAPEPRRLGEIDDARDLAVGWGWACVRRRDGSVWCAGRNERGQLGIGDGTADILHAPVRMLHVMDAASVSLSQVNGCVLTARGTVGCWGENNFGVLGDGAPWSRAYASDVIGLTDAAQVAVVGGIAACVLRRDRTVWCWGLPLGVASDDLPPFASWRGSAPKRVPGLDDIVEIAAGGSHVCARRANGSVVCWGDEWAGDPRTDARRTRPRPVEVLGPE